MPGFDAWPDEPTGWKWRTLADVAKDTPEDSSLRRYAEGPGAGWGVLLHPWLGTPSYIATHGLDLGAAPLDTSKATVALAHEFVAAHRDLLGIDRLADIKLHRLSLTPNPVGHQILGVDFKQTCYGYDVWTPTEAVRVRLRIDATLGRVSVMGSDWIAGLSVRIAPISRDTSIQRALEEIPLAMPGTLSVLGVHTYVLVSQTGEEGTERDVRLVHHVRIGRTEPAAAWSWRACRAASARHCPAPSAASTPSGAPASWSTRMRWAAR